MILKPKMKKRKGKEREHKLRVLFKMENLFQYEISSKKKFEYLGQKKIVSLLYRLTGRFVLYSNDIYTKVELLD